MAEAADQILTIGLSAVAGYGGKMAQDWWTARRAQRQADRALWSQHRQQLYLLSPEEIPDLLASDGDQPRRDDRAVQRLRKRMCYELNFATSSLYRTARYLACARLVHRHLSGGGLELGPGAVTRAQPARERARSRPSRISSSPNRYSLP
jgi:hypothetical protein